MDAETGGRRVKTLAYAVLALTILTASCAALVGGPDAPVVAGALAR